MESKVVVPAEGKKITLQNGKLNVPENPIIPFIEGDGIGFAIGKIIQRVIHHRIANKSQRGETNMGGHAAHLAITSCI